MQSRDIPIGSKKASGFRINLPGAPLVVARAEKGFVMCGFLDIRSADKFGCAAAVVRGVRNVDELLSGMVVEVSAAAQKLGAKPGMTGLDALKRFV